MTLVYIFNFLGLILFMFIKRKLNYSKISYNLKKIITNSCLGLSSICQSWLQVHTHMLSTQLRNSPSYHVMLVQIKLLRKLRHDGLSGPSRCP